MAHIRGNVSVHKTSLTPSLFIEVSVPNQKSEWSCMCVLWVSILPHSKIFQLDLWRVPWVWYFVLFILFHFIGNYSNIEKSCVPSNFELFIEYHVHVVTMQYEYIKKGSSCILFSRLQTPDQSEHWPLGNTGITIQSVLYIHIFQVIRSYIPCWQYEYCLFIMHVLDWQV